MYFSKSLRSLLWQILPPCPHGTFPRFTKTMASCHISLHPKTSKKPRPLGFPPFLSKVKDILQQAAHSSWDALVCRSTLDLGERPWVACWSQNRQLLGPRNCLCKNHFQLAVMFPASTKFQEFKHPLRKWEAKKSRGLWRRNESITWIVQGHSHSFLSFTKEASWTFSDTGLELP